MKNILLLFSFFLVFCVKAQKSHLVKFTLNGKQFDSLRIATYDPIKSEILKIWPKSKIRNSYTFEIADTLWRKIPFIVLGQANEKNRIYEYIALYTRASMNYRDKSKVDGHFIPDLDSITINAIYSNSDTDTILSSQRIFCNFITISVNNSGLKSTIKYPDFCAFNEDTTKDKASYQNQLNRYIQAVKDCPDSKNLAQKMSMQMNKFHSARDAKLVYNCFSNRMKESEYCKRIVLGLKQDWTKFENIYLKNALTSREEKIAVRDSSFKLICFTASWCVFCRKEVPLLKEIYNDLKGHNFEIVSVSVDDNERQMADFQKLVINDSIPWRNLFSHPVRIDKKYQITSYPTSILVYPDNHIEFLDVREKAQRARLYRLVKG